MGLFSRRKKSRKDEDGGGDIATLISGSSRRVKTAFGTKLSQERLQRWNGPRSIGEGSLLMNRRAVESGVHGDAEDKESLKPAVVKSVTVGSIETGIEPPPAPVPALPPAPIPTPAPPISVPIPCIPAPPPPSSPPPPIPETVTVGLINTPTLHRASLSSLSSNKLNSRRNSNDVNLARPSMDSLRTALITENSDKVGPDLNPPSPSDPPALNMKTEITLDSVIDRENLNPLSSSMLSPKIPDDRPKDSPLNKMKLNNGSSHSLHSDANFKRSIDISPSLAPLHFRPPQHHHQYSHPYPQHTYPLPPPSFPAITNTIFYDKSQQIYYEIKPFVPDLQIPTRDRYKILPRFRAEIVSKILDTYDLKGVVVHPRFIFCFLALTLYYTIGIQGLAISFILTLVILEIKIETIQSTGREPEVNGLRIKPSPPDPSSTRFESVYDSVGEGRPQSPITRLSSPMLHQGQ